MKKAMKILLWVLISFCLFGISNAFADPSCMRCERGRELVCIGSPASTVLAKCGSPQSIVEIGSETKTQSEGTIKRKETKEDKPYIGTSQDRSSNTLKLEEWTYCIKESYGSDCYIYILRFKGDKLTKITSTLEEGN